MSELETLFSATVPDSGRRNGGGKSGNAAGAKADKVHLVSNQDVLPFYFQVLLCMYFSMSCYYIEILYSFLVDSDVRFLFIVTYKVCHTPEALFGNYLALGYQDYLCCLSTDN